jgi:hypothetical protein
MAALTIDGIKQCHHRLAHRTITMAQLANHIIQYGTRACTMVLLEAPQPVPQSALHILLAGPSAISGSPPMVVTAAPHVISQAVLQTDLQTEPQVIPLATARIAPQSSPAPRYRCIIPRPSTTPPSTPMPPQQ